MAYDDGVKIAPIAYIGAISVLITLVIVMALQVLYYQYDNRITAAELAAVGTPPELAQLTAKQLTALTQRGYVNRQEKTVAIGIERAMELVLRELASGKRPQEVIGPVEPLPPGSSVPAGEPADGEDTSAKASGESSESSPEASPEPPQERSAPETEEPKDADKS